MLDSLALEDRVKNIIGAIVFRDKVKGSLKIARFLGNEGVED
jgi:hypothetical protein